MDKDIETIKNYLKDEISYWAKKRDYAHERCLREETLQAINYIDAFEDVLRFLNIDS